MEGRIKYWQCPQDPEHVWDFDDWRVQPADSKWANARVWFKAFCPRDGRELVKHEAQVEVNE